MKKKHEIFRALRLSEQEFLYFVSEYVQIPSEAPKVGAASVMQVKLGLGQAGGGGTPIGWSSGRKAPGEPGH